MRRRVPDNTKPRRLVGFDPRTTLDEIILNVAEDRSAAPAERAAGFADQLLAG
jgi:UDP-glucose 4-epimerase